MSEMPYGFLHMVSIDDEISEFTIWGCFHCGYDATENEAEECICEKCWKKTKTKLKDHETEYWWCFTCNETFQQ